MGIALTSLLSTEQIYLITKECMKYRMGTADLVALRYIHAVYSYLQHDIKLSDSVKNPLKESVKTLAKKFSGAVLDAVRADDIVGQFKEIIQEFNELLRLEEENAAKVAAGEKPARRPNKKPIQKMAEEMSI